MKTHAIAAAAGAVLAALAVYFVQDWRHGEAIQRAKTELAEQETKHTKAIEGMRTEYAESLAQANAQALADQTRWEKEKSDAQEKHTQETARLRADASYAWSAYSGLRDTNETLRVRLSEYSERAVRQYANAANIVLTESTGRYAEVAAVADQCIADLRLIQGVWPK